MYALDNLLFYFWQGKERRTCQCPLPYHRPSQKRINYLRATRATQAISPSFPLPLSALEGRGFSFGAALSASLSISMAGDSPAFHPEASPCISSCQIPQERSAEPHQCWHCPRHLLTPLGCGAGRRCLIPHRTAFLSQFPLIHPPGSSQLTPLRGLATRISFQM